MFWKFLSLDWKAFVRAPNFSTKLILKILIAFSALYFILLFAAMGLLVYDMIQDTNPDAEPIGLLSKYALYYIFGDLVFRFFMQKLPVTHIRPLLILPIKKSKIAFHTLFKGYNNFFLWIHIVFLIPLVIRFGFEGYPLQNLIPWAVSFFCFIGLNVMFNTLIGNNKIIFGILLAFIGGISLIHFYTDLDYLSYFGAFFEFFYYKPWAVILAIAIFLASAYYLYKEYLNSLYLDTGMKLEEEKKREFKFLENLGSQNHFLQNDIRLILRNKRSRGTLFMSLFLFLYGLYFFKNTDVFELGNGAMLLLFSIFITGAFLLNFGQFVPSWDSSYYPLLMSQNIRYRDYIISKWKIVLWGAVIFGAASMLYLLKDPLLIYPLVAAILFNIGMNSFLVLITGAFIKTPIDLTQNNKMFGDSKSFNFQALLMNLPMFALPMMLFFVVGFFANPLYGYYTVGGIGLLGLLFKNKFIDMAESLYQKRKYETLEAYKSN